MLDYSKVTHIYTYVWNKYRPAILNLMVAAADSPQQYKFSDLEFRNINPRQKGGYSFVLRVFQGKSVNDIRASEVAKDLLKVLQESRKANELSDISIYEFTLDKNFVLHISKVQEIPEIILEPALSIVES